MNNKNRSRREFLSSTGKLAGGGWLALNAPLLLAAAQAAEEQMAAGEAWVSLTIEEATVLSAVVDQVIPPDDLPGAAEAGVVYFIDQALGGFKSDSRELFRTGVLELEKLAQTRFPGVEGFAVLSFEQQTRILETIDTTPFFNQVIFLTHCGMFANPSWGGNRDQAGWKLLGFDSRHAWQPPFGYYDADEEPGGSGHGNG